MKIAVLNFSGNVGKTTVASHLLMPRIKSAKFFSVESINQGAGDADGIDVDKYRAKKFGDLIEEIMMNEDAIIDIGASNVEEFLKLMQQFDGSHEEIDFFVIPAVKEKKVQADTINTIRTLQKIGIEKKRIRVVFNKVDMDDSITDDFESLFGLSKSEKSCVINQESVIYANEVFERIKRIGKSLDEITNDPQDYRSRLRDAIKEDEKRECVQMIAMKRLGVSANKNLDSVYANLFK